MEQCDAVVVGGGPAGSTAARMLVNGGLDVVVLDKKLFPRDKVCAGWVTPPVWQALQLDPQEYAAAGNVVQPIQSFRTSLLGGDEVETDYPVVVSYAIRRIEFDDFLLRRSGARLQLGCGVESIERKDETWLINGVLETPLLIGAGGHGCPVARLLGAQIGSGPGVVAAQEIEFELSDEQLADAAVQEDRPELFFCPELDGYGWAVRKGRYLNVGLGREHAQGVAQQVAEFRDYLVSKGKIPASAPARFKGHAYQLYPQQSPRPLYGEGVLIVGDAAGLAYPQSGEGIRPAVESALLAADTALAACGDYSAAQLKKYEERMAFHFGPRSTPPSTATRLPEFIKHHVVRWLLANKLFTRRVLLDHWFLHRWATRSS